MNLYSPVQTCSCPNWYCILITQTSNILVTSTNVCAIILFFNLNTKINEQKNRQKLNNTKSKTYISII